MHPCPCCDNDGDDAAKTTAAVKEHVRIAHRNCYLCQKELHDGSCQGVNLTNIKRHMQKCVGASTITPCPNHCGKHFADADISSHNIVLHIAACSKALRNATCPLRGNSDDASLCNTIFPAPGFTNSQLKLHFQEVHGQDNIICPACGAGAFGNWGQLRSHVSAKHFSLPLPDIDTAAAATTATAAMNNNDDNVLSVAVTTTIPAFATMDNTAQLRHAVENAALHSMNIILNHVDRKTPYLKVRRSSIIQDVSGIALMKDHVYGSS